MIIFIYFQPQTLFFQLSSDRIKQFNLFYFFHKLNLSFFIIKKYFLFFKQLLITNMIKSNKLKKKILFPKLNQYNEGGCAYNQTINLKNNQPKFTQIIQSKTNQNRKPMDLTNTTLYLQFPIGTKARRKIKQDQQFPSIKFCPNYGYDNEVFMRRQDCALYKKNKRARIQKFNQECLQCLSQRTNQEKPNNQCKQNLLSKYNESADVRRERRFSSYLIEIQNSVKPSTIWKNQDFNNEKVTRWDNLNKKHSSESGDSFFEQAVEQLKLQHQFQENE